MSTAVKFHSKDARSIPFQEASLDIWDKKYRLSAKDGTPIDQTMDDTYKRVARALGRRRGARGCASLVRAVPVGAAPWRDPGRPRDVERRRAGAQARHLDHQLHRVGHDPRLDGRHPRQGARGGPDAEGRLRHRLRILDAAPARRVRLGRGRLHVGPALVHGYLRQDVLHRVVGRRPPRRADGHVRHRPSRRHGIHPRQARGRPAAPVQPVAAGHRRVHPGRARGQGVAARVPGARGRGRRRGHRRSRASTSGASGRIRRATSATTKASCSARSTRPCRRGACGT